jgi:hypothetical protein
LVTLAMVARTKLTGKRLSPKMKSTGKFLPQRMTK